VIKSANIKGFEISKYFLLSYNNHEEVITQKFRCQIDPQSAGQKTADWQRLLRLSFSKATNYLVPQFG
jgi:hypothetical protein